MELMGRLVKETPDNLFYAVPSPPGFLVERKQYLTATVTLHDSRQITTKQRNAIFATIQDITDYISAPPPRAQKAAYAATLREMGCLYVLDKTDSESVRRQLTAHYCDAQELNLFSLSTLDETSAGAFLDYLIEICIVHGIPCNDSLLNRSDDLARYVYNCCINRRCAVCGKRAEIHHAEDRIGMGRSRETISHIGMRVQPLCRGHHNEAHAMGQQSFNNLYHLQSVEVDAELAQKFKLGKVKNNE
jgi:hypothetical protein